MSEKKKKTTIPEGLRENNKAPSKEDQNALMSLAFGVIGLALSCAGYGAIFGLFGIVFGVLGLKSENRRSQAIAGIILCVLSVALMIVVYALEAANGNVQ